MNWWDVVRDKAMDWHSLQMPEPAIDLDKLTLAQKKDVETARAEAERLLESLGISQSEKDVLLGKTVQQDNTTVYKSLKEEMRKKGLVLEDMNTAVKSFPWLEKYFFKIFDINENALTAYHTKNWNNGVFVHANKGSKFTAPVHTFFLLSEASFAQTPHSIIVAEDDSEVHMVEGCTSPMLSESSLHIGGTEIYVGKNAKVYLTKLQHWPSYVHTRPITFARVEEGGELNLVNIIIGGGKTTVEKPGIHLVGKGARATVREVVLSRKSAYVDIGSNVYHDAEDTHSQVISKSVATDNSKVITRGVIHGLKPGAKGHISCDGMILGDEASSEAYPGLNAALSDVQLSHEASFGRIADKELFYLRTRGFSEEEAVELIVKGFVSPAMVDVPFEFRTEVNKIIELAAKGM